MKIRIKFSKQGPVRFIGHLDVMRYFQKAVRRAGIDIRYSEGFSPHQIMSFAAPLSVGLVSNGEYMDIETHSAMPPGQMADALNACGAEGIRVLSCRVLKDSAKNAMSQVAAADYTFWFKEGRGPESAKERTDFYEEFCAFCARPVIEITKQAKKGEKTVDIKPFIYTVSRIENGVFMRLSAGSAANVKPEQALAAFYASKGMEYPPFAFQIQREELYADAGNDGAHCFIPLEEYGTEGWEAF